ncbi:unnamed protein product, partial [Discosporangium mesarthrocarpum]
GLGASGGGGGRVGSRKKRSGGGGRGGRGGGSRGGSGRGHAPRTQQPRGGRTGSSPQIENSEVGERVANSTWTTGEPAHVEAVSGWPQRPTVGKTEGQGCDRGVGQPNRGLETKAATDADPSSDGMGTLGSGGGGWRVDGNRSRQGARERQGQEFQVNGEIQGQGEGQRQGNSQRQEGSLRGRGKKGRRGGKGAGHVQGGRGGRTRCWDNSGGGDIPVAEPASSVDPRTCQTSQGFQAAREGKQQTKDYKDYNLESCLVSLMPMSTAGTDTTTVNVSATAAKANNVDKNTSVGGAWPTVTTTSTPGTKDTCGVTKSTVAPHSGHSGHSGLLGEAVDVGKGGTLQAEPSFSFSTQAAQKHLEAAEALDPRLVEGRGDTGGGGAVDGGGGGGGGAGGGSQGLNGNSDDGADAGVEEDWPKELVFSGDGRIVESEWTKYYTQEGEAKPYWHSSITDESQWEEPEEVTRCRHARTKTATADNNTNANNININNISINNNSPGMVHMPHDQRGQHDQFQHHLQQQQQHGRHGTSIVDQSTICTPGMTSATRLSAQEGEGSTAGIPISGLEINVQGTTIPDNPNPNSAHELHGYGQDQGQGRVEAGQRHHQLQHSQHRHQQQHQHRHQHVQEGQRDQGSQGRGSLPVTELQQMGWPQTQTGDQVLAQGGGGKRTCEAEGVQRKVQWQHGCDDQQVESLTGANTHALLGERGVVARQEHGHEQVQQVQQAQGVVRGVSSVRGVWQGRDSLPSQVTQSSQMTQMTTLAASGHQNAPNGDPNFNPNPKEVAYPLVMQAQHLVEVGGEGFRDQGLRSMANTRRTGPGGQGGQSLNLSAMNTSPQQRHHHHQHQQQQQQHHHHHHQHQQHQQRRRQPEPVEQPQLHQQLHQGRDDGQGPGQGPGQVQVQGQISQWAMDSQEWQRIAEGAAEEGMPHQHQQQASCRAWEQAQNAEQREVGLDMHAVGAGVKQRHGGQDLGPQQPQQQPRHSFPQEQYAQQPSTWEDPPGSWKRCKEASPELAWQQQAGVQHVPIGTLEMGSDPNQGATAPVQQHPMHTHQQHPMPNYHSTNFDSTRDCKSNQLKYDNKQRARVSLPGNSVTAITTHQEQQQHVLMMIRQEQQLTHQDPTIQQRQGKNQPDHQGSNQTLSLTQQHQANTNASVATVGGGLCNPNSIPNPNHNSVAEPASATREPASRVGQDQGWASTTKAQ